MRSTATQAPLVRAPIIRNILTPHTPPSKRVSIHWSVLAIDWTGLRATSTPKILSISHRTVEVYRARLMRKYNAARDDHAIFPEPLLSQYLNEGDTLNSGSDWLGYVYENTNGNVPTIQ